MDNIIAGSPNPNATFEEKLKPEYGVKVGRFIGAEWFAGGLISSNASCNFMKRRDFVNKNRLYVRGEQDINQYKKLETKGDDDLSMENLNWQIVNYVEKYCRLIANSIDSKNFRLDIRATDKFSMNIKQNKIKEHQKNMITKPLLESAKEHLGIDMLPKGQIPEDEEELSLLMEMEDKPRIEIAEQLLINYIKKSNDFDYIESQTKWDEIVNGLMGVRVYTDKNNGVMISYVDPENYIHSEVNRNDFADKFYEGVVDTITLSDLRREASDEISEIELRKIAMLYGSTNGNVYLTNYTYCPIAEILDYKINVLRFAWKTSKTIVYKTKVKNGQVVKASRKSESFVAPDKEDVGVMSKTFDTWLEGNYIVGSNTVYGYKECENLERDMMNKALSPFVFMATDIYKNNPKSFLTDIKPITDEMQGIVLKLQSLRKRLKPDVIEIDIDQLAELDGSKGGVKKEVWQNALSILQIEGVVFKKRINMGDDGIKDSAAAKTNAQPQGSAITVLLNLMAFHANQIREITGINPFRDGSMGNDALVGVSEMAQMASNTTTKHFVDTSVAFNRKLNEVISTRIGGIFKAKEARHIQEIYENVVGKEMVDAIQILADRHLHEFGFLFEMYPTVQELKEFQEDLSLALTSQSIDVAVKIQAANIARLDTKLATRYLLYAGKKKKKEDLQNEMMLSQNKSQNDAQAAQAKVQADTQGYQIKLQADLEYARQLAQVEVEKLRAINEMQIPYDENKFKQDVYLEQIKANSVMQKNQMVEDNKDTREVNKDTRASQMIDQRKKESDPIDFEGQKAEKDIFNL
jgi:hypothetical protein